MAKLTFKLRNNKDNSASIQLFFNYGYSNRLRYSTGLKVNNKNNWDDKRQKVKRVTEEIDHLRINNLLNELEYYLEKEYYKLLEQKEAIINNDLLKELCNVFFGKSSTEKKESKLELLPFFDWFIINYSTKPLVSTGKPLKHGTARTYRNSSSLLKRFSNDVYQVTYDKVGITFYYDFLNWMYKNNYSTNYIGTQIKILKTILNASFELMYHSSIEHNKRYFKKPNEQVYSIFLNQEELNKINKLDFRNTPTIKVKNTSLYLNERKLNNARDLFLISAYTGLRVSDFNKLKFENIVHLEGRNYFQIITVKNEKHLTIPINSIVQSILKKREGNPPENVPNQHLNYALKEIGELAGIDSTVIIEKTTGGVKEKNSYKKYELITNHTGRRSFCTNAYLAGMNTIDIMAISGHSTEKVFYNYIKVNHLDRAKNISKHQFFK